MKIKKLKVDYKTPLKTQLKKLGIKNYLDLNEVTNLYPQKKTIYDIETGEEMLGKSPKECEEEFKKQGRRGLNIYEGLAIIRECPNILEKYYIDLVGSRGERVGKVPNVCLRGGVSRLGWGSLDGSDGRWGSASKGIIINKSIFSEQTIGFLDLFGTLELNGYKYEIKIKSIK